MKQGITKDTNIEQVKNDYSFGWIKVNYKNGKSKKLYLIDVADDYQKDWEDSLNDPFYKVLICSDKDVSERWAQGKAIGGSAVLFDDVESIETV